MTEPLATIRGYRAPGYGIIRVRRGLAVRHHRVSLKRYEAMRAWTAFRYCRSQSSGCWMRDGFTVHLWAEPHFPDLERRANLSPHMFLKLQAD